MDKTLKLTKNFNLLLILLLTVCPVFGQTVTLNKIGINTSANNVKILSYGDNSSILNVSTQILLSNKSAGIIQFNLAYPPQSHRLALKGSNLNYNASFNRHYSFDEFQVEVFFLVNHNQCNAFLLRIHNKIKDSTRCVVFDFSNEPNSKSMFKIQVATKEFRDHVTIINSILYFTAFSEDKLYLIQYDLTSNKILTAFKTALKPMNSGNSLISFYNIIRIDSSTIIISFYNQLYIISIPDISIKKLEVNDGYIIQDILVGNNNLVLSLRNDSVKANQFSFVSIKQSGYSLNWAYSLEIPSSWDSGFQFLSGYKINSRFLFVFNNYSFFNYFTLIIKIDPDKLENSVVYGFHGKLQDMRKIDNQHFKITGTVNTGGEKVNEAMFYGDLYLDGRGECPLDTTCVRFDTLTDFTITPFNNVVIEDVSISLKDAEFIVDSVSYSASPLSCNDYEHKTEGEFLLLSDTICHTDLSEIFEYDKGYYDASDWKIYLNDSLVYSASIGAPALDEFMYREGELRMEHYLTVGGCTYYHEDSVFLVGENQGLLQSDVSSICPGESALLFLEADELTIPISASWHNSNQELLGTGNSIRVKKAGDYVARLDNGFCQWTETISIETAQEGCETSIYIPNAFTPNDDGMNDTWSLYSRFPVKATVEIYDRWGGRVYACEGVDCVWDGTFKREPMPPGVYVYKVDASVPQSEQIIHKTGTLELIR